MSVSVLSFLSRTPVAVEIPPVSTKVIEVPSEEYLKLAAKLGVRAHAADTSATLEEVLREEMIHVYPMGAVSKYMRRITPRGRIWGWKSLREADYMRAKGHVRFDNSRNGVFLEGIYSRPVPFPALLTIEGIEQASKLSAHPAFFVSDYAVASPDPFLMVTMPAFGESQWRIGDGSGRLFTANPEPACFVVERWDEPSFR